MTVNHTVSKILLPLLAALAYLSVSLFAVQYMDERNKVFHGRVLPAGDHWPIAQQIMNGEKLTNFWLPPGFPLYIVAAVKATEYWGGSYFFWRLVEDCLSTAVTTILITALMLRLTNSAWVAWGANILLIYNLTYSAGTAAHLAMASFLPWFYGGLLLLIQSVQGENKQTAVQASLAGVLVAISGFFRPDILLLLPFLAVIFRITSVWQRTNLIHGSIPAASSSLTCFLSAFLGFGLILLPWVVFASVRSGSLIVYSTNFVPSHIVGMSRFPGNPVSDTFRPLINELNTVGAVIAMHYTLIKKYPLDWIVLWLHKVWRPWYASESQRWDTILAMQTLLILPAVLYGAYLWWRKRGLDLAFILAFSIITYFWIVSMTVVPINRYMPPVYPFLGMFAGLFGQVQWLRISSRWKSSVLSSKDGLPPPRNE